jgi:hypothetical protein
MCTGVIAITPTITRCPTAVAATPRRAAGLGRVADAGPVPRRDPARDEHRIGAQPGEQRRRGDEEHHHRARERAGEGREPVALERRAGQRREVGPGDGAEGRRPDDEGEVAAVLPGGREVDGGVARL